MIAGTKASCRSDLQDDGFYGLSGAMIVHDCRIYIAIAVPDGRSGITGLYWYTPYLLQMAKKTEVHGGTTVALEYLHGTVGAFWYRQ